MKDLLVAHWWKAVVVLITGGIMAWGSYITLLAQRGVSLAEQNQASTEQIKEGSLAELKKYLDMQVGVLHGRSTSISIGQEADETRLENRLWELQLRFFEDEIDDCEEELEDCEKGK